MTKKTSSKNERTNLFFYPDGPEILETWNQNLKFQVIPDCQDRKTNSSVRFWKKFFFEYFAFEIYWPLIKSLTYRNIKFNFLFVLRNQVEFNFLRSKLHNRTTDIAKILGFYNFIDNIFRGQVMSSLYTRKSDSQ